ncbi:hypothetical protein ACE6H2_020961 [Prunus campanulata]
MGENPKVNIIAYLVDHCFHPLNYLRSLEVSTAPPPRPSLQGVLLTKCHLFKKQLRRAYLRSFPERYREKFPKNRVIENGGPNLAKLTVEKIPRLGRPIDRGIRSIPRIFSIKYDLTYPSLSLKSHLTKFEPEFK